MENPVTGVFTYKINSFIIKELMDISINIDTSYGWTIL